jgi:tRNA pseudouridine55 synthase
MQNGIILIDKEKDITSYDVIRRLKKQFPRKYKIGHGGTLDPFATGLLIILVGKATKLMNSIHKLEKEYVVDAEFGYETDTQDNTGKIVGKEDSILSKEEIEKILPKFVGKINQIPPQYSAKKVNGKRAYDLAREGKEFKLEPKVITIHSIEVIKFEWPRVTFRVSCSTGTYMRTIVNDIAKELGTLATAVELRRTRIGEFKVEDAYSSSEIDKREIEKAIINIEDLKL